MSKTPKVSPPRWATRLLQWYCKPELLEDLQGDLNEYFERNCATRSNASARLIYIADVFKFFRLYTLRKPEFLNLLIQWIMLGSYIKTSGRTLVRNKLFSAINIIGLAISMSIGLLMIAFLSDLTSFDDFHANKDRIYRLKTTRKHLDNPPTNLASTSIKAGRLIRENVPGIENLVVMRRGFSIDAQYENNIVPVDGMFADTTFFNVFSFKLLQGNPSTALAAPNSIVLTETTAKKLFGDGEALGKSIHADSIDYTVSGVMEDIPKFSHMKFESLISFSTFERSQAANSNQFDWKSVWSNYVYLVLDENTNIENVQSELALLAKKENANDDHTQIDLSLQPLKTIVLGEDLSNQIGPTMQISAIYVIAGLAFVVILSACFNYTNLSIARSLRRSREVGIRKVIGALRMHVLMQFIAEATMISLLALVLSFGLFLIIRPQFLALAPELANVASLDLSLKLVGYFVLMAVSVGLLAGFLPAIFFSKINPVQVLKDASKVKVFKNVSLRKALIVVQYTFSLIFITATVIGYGQYKGFLAFDLGFSTENILNIQLEGNKPDLVSKEMEALPEVTDISRSLMITSVGSYYGSTMKYINPDDSANVWYNGIDERYLPLHGHKLLAGRNLRPLAPGAEESEILVNEETLKRFDIGKRDPEKAIGEEITLDGKKLTIVGVLKDFHYGKADSELSPVVFLYKPEEKNGYLNLKITSADWPATFKRLEAAWHKVDAVHPLKATFYTDQIEHAYGEFSVMIKVIGFLAFLAITIASMGLLGMVVFTTETRLREISIRKVLGASEGNLIYLLSRGFLLLLGTAIFIALPATYFFFQKVVLTNFTYHEPIRISDLLVSVVIVMGIAFLLIGSQTMRVARRNPSEVLKGE